MYVVHYFKSGERAKFMGKFIGFNVLRFPIFEQHNRREAIPTTSIYRISHKQQQL